MEITTDMIKQLRDETGVSIGKCKDALTEAKGDLAAARELLKSYGAKAVAKSADRELGAGLVVSYVHGNGSVGTLLELACETDFVAKNEDFVILANDIAMHITAMGSEADNLKNEPFVKNPEVTIGDLIQVAIQKLGERIEVQRFTRYELLA